MKILKMKWSWFAIILFFSLFSYGSDFSRTNELLIAKRVIIAEKLNEIVPIFDYRGMQFKKFTFENLSISAEQMGKLESLELLLDWFIEYTKTENKIVKNNGGTLLERYGTWFMLAGFATHCLSLDITSVCGAAIGYGLPAVYCANKVVAPKTRRKLKRLKNITIKNYPSDFQDILANNSHDFTVIVGLADGFYRALKNPDHICLLNQEKTHLNVERLITGNWYQVLYLWEKGNEPWKKISGLNLLK